MKKSKLKVILFSLFMIFFIIVGLFYPSHTDASVEDDSVSSTFILNSDGEKVTTITMSKGVIEIINTSHTATNEIKWETMGLTVTRKPLDEITYDYEAEEGTYHLTGVENLGPDSEDNILLFDQAFDKDSVTDPSTGLTTTTIRFSSKQVKNALGGEDFSKITRNTPLFLHGIFRVYTQVSKDVKAYHTGQSNIRNWKDILLAEYWDRSDNQLDDFYGYYNMEIDFQPDYEDNTLYYYSDGNQKIGSHDLEQKLPGETVSWSNEPTEKTYQEKNYELYKYIIKRKSDGATVATHSIGDSDGCTLDKIRSGETMVQLGGMNVYLYYREVLSSKIIIKAVDIDTQAILNENMYSHTVTAKEPFNTPVDLSIQKDGKTYKKTENFYYTYVKNTNETGVEHCMTENWDDAIAFTIPADLKAGGTVTVYVYYKKTVGGIPVTVLAVNKSTSVAISTLKTDAVMGGGAYSYTASESITSGSTAYQYTGAWEWSYKKNTSTVPTVVKSGTGIKVSFTAPSADEISGGITVKIYYEAVPDKNSITLRVIMVAGTGNLIEEISKETVTRGQSISKAIQQKRSSADGIIYNYLNKWDYTYFTSSGSSTKSGTGNTASFIIPITTNLGTVVTLRLYYDTTQNVEVPEASGPISVSLDSPSPYGVINGDKYNSSYFTSELGIPTTESQYVFVRTKDYLLGYTLVNKTGKVKYNVTVTMIYNLEYYTATPDGYNGGPKLVKTKETRPQVVQVEKAYSYWEIKNLEYYNIGTASVYNYSLPGGNVSLSAKSAYVNAPSLYTWHSSDIKDHVKPPIQVETGITIDYPKPLTSAADDRPEIENEDLTAYALTMTDEAQVKNDYILFNGNLVLSDAYAVKTAPDPNTSSFVQCTTITPDKALFTEGKIIDAVKENGRYTSNGSVTYYRNPSSINAVYSTRSYNTDVNSVIIHTPVICVPNVAADNDQWSQVINPIDGAVQIVLDPDMSLNDFTVNISNTLQHSSRLGYYIRDFSRSFIDPENISYIAKEDGVVRNEIKLPFDVYQDVLQDGKAENDKYIKSGTWIVLGREKFKFYVPMWVQEGTYTAQFRSVSVNGADKLAKTETTRNSSIFNYIATSSVNFQISGRIYGLTLYDISDYPKWENIFRVNKTMLFKLFEGAEDGTKRTDFNEDYSYYYTVGTRDQYGNETGRYSKYTIPLVNGSHPKYKNLGVLKTGYAVRFRLDTIGEMYSNACHVKITPTFYYVDADGKNRRQVDLYYDEEINNKAYRLVKAGEGIDLINIKSGMTGNIYSRIPEKEIENTAAVMHTTYSKAARQRSTIYSYTVIKLLNTFRTFIGFDYAKYISSLNSFSAVSVSTGLTQLSLTKYTQRWYGTYKIPVNVHAVASGYDVYDYMKKHGIDYSEDFWLRNGYIIVNFDIVTIDKNGKEHLSYINGSNYLNKGNCSMWITEGAPVQKTDNKGTVFNFKAGDFIIYDTDKKYSDDYEGRLY